MSVRPVLRLGHPILRQVGRSLKKDEILSPNFQALIKDMHETMQKEGGIGLAAPQIGESLQVAIIEIASDNERYQDEIEAPAPFQVFVNPVIRVTDPTPQTYWEGCLSVPGFRGKVTRPRGIEVDYLDEKAEPHTAQVSGFLATVFQHELDHLAGKLYVDHLKLEPGADGKMSALPLSFTEEYEQFILPTEDDEIGHLED